MTTTELLLNYQQIKPHLNIFNLAENRILLHLYVDDISTGLSQITQNADAWFLDGFAQQKMLKCGQTKFSSKLLVYLFLVRHLRLLRAPVWFEEFNAVWFNVQKISGFGKKREMLSGVFV
jgi:tRNA 5-methylaminomethyl-2-thiouridine biosynthesis bifunctional protein